MKRFLLRLLDKIGSYVLPETSQETRIQIIQRDPCRLSLDEWRSSDVLTAQARKCLSDVVFRSMLDVLDRSHPVHAVLNDTVELQKRAIWQARCEGYTMCIADLESMGVYDKPKEKIEATFDPPETEE